MDYHKFYLAVRRYAKRKITRGEFCVDWGDIQRQQGIEVKKLNGPKGAKRWRT